MCGPLQRPDGTDTEECAQLRRLRKEVRTLRTEREILDNPLRSACAGGERPLPQTILQRAAGRRAPAERTPRRGAVPPRRFVR